MSSHGSIPFDRAAEVYEETQRLTPEASAATPSSWRPSSAIGNRPWRSASASA